LKRADGTGASQVVLILAPLGRDAELAASVLHSARIVSKPCHSLSELSGCLRAEGNSVGALLLTEESLAPPADCSSLTEWLEHQEPWSDLPIVFFTRPGRATRVTARRLEALGPRGAVTVLERPVPPGRLARRATRRSAVAPVPVSGPGSIGISASRGHRTAKRAA
jgi:hypothetical protein